MQITLRTQSSAADVFNLIQIEGETHSFEFIELDSADRMTFTYNHEGNVEHAIYTEIDFKDAGAGCHVQVAATLPVEDSKLKSDVEKFFRALIERADVEAGNAKERALVGRPMIPKDSLGNELAQGDTVKTIKDLNVKGSSMVVKRGTVVKKIQLIPGNDTEIGCKVDGIGLNLETRWLAKMT